MPKYSFVRAIVDDVWSLPNRHLVRVLVDLATWSIDGRGVEVERGLVVGFTRKSDADYVLTVHEGERFGVPRCEPVSVVPGMIVAFEREDDANFFIAAGKAVHVTPDELRAEMEAAHAATEPEEDDVLKGKDIENKAATPAPETKASDKPAAPKAKAGRKAKAS